MTPCGVGDRMWPHNSQFAYIWKDSKNFVVAKDRDAEKALSLMRDDDGICETVAGSKEPQVFACYRCCEAFHGQCYTNKRGNLNGLFRNQADLSKGRNHKCKIGRMCNTIDTMMGSEGVELQKMEEVTAVARDTYISTLYIPYFTRLMSSFIWRSLSA